ncbi:hypothetical protein EVAR_50215_1 [Eumeta japonica]|uniref:Uncharacterized protein n=1 Tax=Eumeta variegata TaxID=151549 RepID=A0A4C1X0D0_EUMVA|nr:hypothetical protein EVAR_50215_1 [Eumeta japonica]
MFQDDVFEELVQYLTSMRASFEKYFPEDKNTKMKLNSWIDNPFLPNMQKPETTSLTAYRNEMIREIERNQLRQVHDEKDGRLVSVVSPSRTRTRPSSTLMPVYRAPSATASSSSTSSGVSEVAAALRRRQKKPHALRMPQKKRVGTTDSLLAAAGLGDSSDGSRSEAGAPHSPTSYLSMPSVRSFPRGNVVEPLSRVLEPVSVRHLDIDSPSETPEATQRPSTSDKPKEPQEKVHKLPETVASNPDAVPRRQMASQLVRLGSIDKDPGVVGPLVWDLHRQRIKDASKPTSPAKTSTFVKNSANVSRMRQRFNELVDDALGLFGSPSSGPAPAAAPPHGTVCDRGKEEITQARNDNVQLPGSPYTARDTLRGRSAGLRAESSSNAGPSGLGEARPLTSFPRAPPPARRPPPARAWDQPQMPPTPTVNPAFVLSEGRLPPEDPALPLISAIKSEIQRVREHSRTDDN